MRDKFIRQHACTTLCSMRLVFFTISRFILLTLDLNSNIAVNITLNEIKKFEIKVKLFC